MSPEQDAQAMRLAIGVAALAGGANIGRSLKAW
jgi:hypothetical protein